MLDVSIILVNYKNYKMTLNAVNSINEKSDGFNYEIIVVDNSNDKEEFLSLSKALNNKAKVIDAKGNIGFGRGNNLGAKEAKGKYLYFINNDTLLINNAIYELYSFMENNPQVGIVGSNLYTKKEEPNHSFIPFEKNYHNEKKLLSFSYKAISKLKRKRIDFNYSSSPKHIKGYVCGASLFIKKEAFDSLGGFDKEIFMYAEESLLCYQLIHNLKLDIYNIPSSKIIHLEGGEDEIRVISKDRAKEYVNGNTIYYTRLFGKETCLKYLKMMAKKYRRINKVKALLRKDNRNSVAYMNAYQEKYNELRG